MLLDVVQELGRKAVVEAGGVLPLTTLLQAPEAHVHARAAGALHNLSSHPEAIRILRMGDAIPRLVELLRYIPSPSPPAQVCA